MIQVITRIITIALPLIAHHLLVVATAAAITIDNSISDRLTCFFAHLTIEIVKMLFYKREISWKPILV